MTEVTIWSGWIGGIAIGTYALLQFYLTGNPLGVSSAFTDACSLVAPGPFFRKNRQENGFSWRIWFVLGIPLGGFIAALSSPGPLVASFSLGPLYDSVLPAVPWVRGLVLSFGGILLGLGSRMAGGCTSGHSINGLGLLNPPSLLASIGFFVGGILIVQVLFNFFG
jgi:uncharacterized membrane protein YedE/YeeE